MTRVCKCIHAFCTRVFSFCAPVILVCRPAACRRMADSKLHGEGLMVAAMAFRVKYRKTDTDGKVVKSNVRIAELGVHRKNRGGVYPAGVRCVSLCEEVVPAGFVKEEVNHALIAVEIRRPSAVAGAQCPDDEKADDGASATAYNAEHCMKDEHLITCFKAPYDDVRFSLLSHNHIMLVMRAFLTNAKWDLQPIDAKNITFCDDDGRLSVAAVAAGANGKELGEVMAEGVMVEVLSWKMDVEEPDAASIISQAMNQPQQLSMRTTEITAINVMKGEIIVQMGKDVSQRVAFKTVRDRVRTQLHTAADDPDLQEVFDFLISIGVGKNTYTEDLLEWAARYVDSKRRQLRFAAFAGVNKMCPQAVWSKIAVVKRAYRCKPTGNGFCPSPEPPWKDFHWAQLQKLEDLLRFFHGSCKDIIVYKLNPQSRIVFLANVDIAAAEAFYAAAQTKTKGKYAAPKVIQDALLAATTKYLAQLGLDEDADTVKNLRGDSEWISFKKDAKAADTTPTTPMTTPPHTVDSAPCVVTFDEATGVVLNQQRQFEKTTDKKTGRVNVPWREWRNDHGGKDIANGAADKACAIKVLHCIHERFAVDKEPINVWQLNGHNSVTAIHKTRIRGIMIPPCIPKQRGVLDTSVHPHTVPIKVCVRNVLDDPGDHTTPDILRESTYFVNPEFRPPPQAPTAVAACVATASMGAATAPAAVAEWAWGKNSDWSMSPFWAVRRTSPSVLAKEVAQCIPGSKKRPPRFNCTLEDTTLTDVFIGVIGSACTPCNLTRTVDVPILVNFVEVASDEELILEIADKIETKKARTWKDQHKDDCLKEQQEQKAKAHATKKAKAAPKV